MGAASMQPFSLSPELWAAMRPDQRAALEMMAQWREKARKKQLTPPGGWSTWLILAGRGWGKTRTGAQDAAIFALANPGTRLAVVAPTYSDARDTCVEGESGLLNVIPRACVEGWSRSLGELILLNGSRFKLFSADAPERLRGPQHHRAWADELAAWRYPEAWDQLLFGLRLGKSPRAVVTTTPKPIELVRGLLATPGTVATRGSTFDNAANLAPAALAGLRAKYEGTRLGRQELQAEMLEDTPGALWTREMIERARAPHAPAMQRVVIGVDPSGSDGSGGDSQGIVAAGLGVDGRAYVLEDASVRLSPDGWARAAALAYERHRADRVVAESNFGGAMVEAVLRTAAPNLPVTLVSASRGKAIRAEPVAALYEQGRVSHVGSFPELEDQMSMMTRSGYAAKGSPDRLDALAWALTALMLDAERGWGVLELARRDLAATGQARAPAEPALAAGSVEWLRANGTLR